MENLIWLVCGIWFVGIPAVTGIWFAWLNRRGELIRDVPEDVKDIF